MQVSINPNHRIQTEDINVENVDAREINAPRTVLDHGFVRLVDYMGNDLSVVRSARVSFDADWRGGDDKKDENLIGYLLRNKHYSPFESVVFTFEIKCPIFVARQWHRHWSWRFNEVSARYTELPEEFYLPDPRIIGTQSKNNKQARDINEDPKSFERLAGDQLAFEQHCKMSFNLYQELLRSGWPREIARSILPVGTYTRFFGTANLRSVLNFLDLRLHSHAQYEIRVYGEAILDIIRHIVPTTTGHWNILRDVKNG